MVTAANQTHTQISSEGTVDFLRVGTRRVFFPLPRGRTSLGTTQWPSWPSTNKTQHTINMCSSCMKRAPFCHPTWQWELLDSGLAQKDVPVKELEDLCSYTQITHDLANKKNCWICPSIYIYMCVCVFNLFVVSFIHSFISISDNKQWFHMIPRMIYGDWGKSLHQGKDPKFPKHGTRRWGAGMGSPR